MTIRPATALLLPALLGLAACETSDRTAAEPEPTPMTEPAADDRATPPPNIQAWMDRLTVPHEYDPETGFIVAKRTIDLPPIIADAPPLDEALRLAEAEGRTLIAFATADRCAPCQQYKKDALNDPRVIAKLADPRLVVTHVEVDRQAELAEKHLGSRGIPMTYALAGERRDVLRGQRSAEELLAFLEGVLGG